MDPENHWLVEENHLPGGPLSGSMLVFGSVYTYTIEFDIMCIYIYMYIYDIMQHNIVYI